MHFTFVDIVCTYCFVSIGFVNCDFIHPVGEEEYQVLLSLATGNFATPKRERSNVEKVAVFKFWRSKGRFATDGSGKVLLFDKKELVHRSYNVNYFGYFREKVRSNCAW